MPIAGVLLLKKTMHALRIGVLSLMIAPYPIMQEPSLLIVRAVFVE
jgi:hypothetical protein